MSFGLALSGGGAKGAAHIGVLQALKEENINVDYIAGTSSGSIVATLYAAGYTPFNIMHMFNSYCKYIADYDKMIPFKLMGTIFTGKISVKGFAKGDKLESIIRGYCFSKNIQNINQIQLPLAIPTVDLNTGEIVYFLNKQIEEENSRGEFDDSPTYIYSGNIASIVRASSSFPGVFEPKILNKRVLVDGGVRVNSPVSILKKMGAKKVLTICFEENKQIVNNLNIISVAMKSFDIMGHQVNEDELVKSDYILRPKLDDVSLLECGKTNTLAHQGYLAVKENISQIKKMLKV